MRFLQCIRPTQQSSTNCCAFSTQSYSCRWKFESSFSSPLQFYSEHTTDDSTFFFFVFKKWRRAPIDFHVYTFWWGFAWRLDKQTLGNILYKERNRHGDNVSILKSKLTDDLGPDHHGENVFLVTSQLTDDHGRDYHGDNVFLITSQLTDAHASDDVFFVTTLLTGDLGRDYHGDNVSLRTS